LLLSYEQLLRILLQLLCMVREKRSFGEGSGRGAYMKWLSVHHPKRMRQIASKGGQTSHGNGTAHEWTAQDGRDANAMRKVRGHRGSRRS